MPVLDFSMSPMNLRIGRGLILGPSGSGKTVFAAALIRDLQWPKELIRCVAPPSKPKLSQLLGVPHYGLSPTDREAQDAFFRNFFEKATLPYDQGGTDLGLALDDADFYFSQAGRTYGTSALQEIVKLGREAGVSQVLVAQGSSSISKDLISNSTVVVFFRTVEPNLLDYAQRYMRDVPGAVEVISNLPPHVGLVYAPTQTPKIQGVAKVVNGRIEWRDWVPPEEETTEEPESPEPSPSSTESTEPGSPDDTAEGAERSSPTGTGGATAPTATPPPEPRTSD